MMVGTRGGTSSIARRTHAAVDMPIGQPFRRGGEEEIEHLREHWTCLFDWRVLDITYAYETKHEILKRFLDAR